MTEQKLKAKESMIKHYEAMPLWKLVFKLAEKEKQLIEVIKTGDNTKQSINKYNKKKYKRNMIRKVMLDKLKKWDKKELYDDLTYADLTEKYRGVRQ